MAQLSPYLTFSGNCREAMTFYANCLGGELNFQAIGESPMAAQMPDKMKDCILHSTLRTGELEIMATDCVPQGGLLRGNSVSLSMQCGNEEEIRTVFEKLAFGGTVTHPLENTFWGALFGGLTDRYGNHWLLNYQK